MPFAEVSTDLLNLDHPLLSGLTNLWLPTPALAGANRLWDIRGAGYRNDNGLLTNGPTWRNTPFGPGVETGVVAKNAYVDLAGFQLSRNFSMLFAYTYRFDTTTSGSNTESGVLFSAGFNGVALRHGFGGKMTLLKSRVTALVDVAAAATAGDFRTAGFSIDSAGTATMTVFSQGRTLGSVSSATTFTGQAPTTLGWDNLTPGTDDEYGRHTILAAALWNGRVLTAGDAYLWHEIAGAGWYDFFQEPSPFAGGTSSPSVIDWLPVRKKSSSLNATIVVTPSLVRRASWLFDFGNVTPRPPSGPGRGREKPNIRRAPQDDTRRIAHTVDVLKSWFNSLANTGQLRKTGLENYELLTTAHTDTRAPGAMDDGDNGYPIGCPWIDTSTDSLYICVNNTSNAAVWRGPI